ncbi:MAG: hypothetical protein WC243_03275 [Patescibacteria group bacterium]
MQGIIYLNNTSKGTHTEEEDQVVPKPDESTTYQPPLEEVVVNEDKRRESDIEEDKIVEKSIDDNKLSGPFRKYLKSYNDAVLEEEKKCTNPIYVDEIASKVAQFYESVRRIVDWKEEHLIRRSAIERILRRSFVSQIYGMSLVPDVDASKIAEPIAFELVRSGHFKNGTISRGKILDIQQILEKYLHILKNVHMNGEDKGRSRKEVESKIKRKINFTRWALELASCEIEYMLDPPLREYALLDLMVDSLMQRIDVVPVGKMSDVDVHLQTYIAVRKALFNFDAPMIDFDIMRLKHPDFFGSSVDLTRIARDIPQVWEELETDLNHPKAPDFYAIAERYDAPYLLIGDAMNKSHKNSQNVDDMVSHPADFLPAIEEVYNTRLATLKKRLYKLAIFSTLSIFIAGGVSLLIFEIPIATLIRGYFSPWAIVADLAIPTALMFLLVSIIKPPSKDNLAVVKDEIQKIVYKVRDLDVYEIRFITKKRKFQNIIFAIVYLAGGFFSLYFIYWLFKVANVPWSSLYIDTVNVAMVVFAAMVIKQRSNELTVIERDNLFDFALEPFSIPLAKIGAWISSKWREYNIVSILFGALIDLPFATFVAGLEGWRNFIKEKRSGLH